MFKKIKKDEFAEFFPIEDKGAIVALKFETSQYGIALTREDANIAIAKHNKRVAEARRKKWLAELDEAAGKRIQARVSIAKALSDAKEGKRAKAPKTNENKKDDKSSAETPNRSEKPLKSKISGIRSEACEKNIKGVNVQNAKNWRDVIERQIKHAPELDEAERKYLESALAPFKDTLAYVKKASVSVFPYERITAQTADSIMAFPWFDEGKMYKGLWRGEKYTPEELGLWKK